MTTLADGSKGKLVVESVANIGPHYARTLREWRQRFVQRFEDIIVPALRKEYAAGGAAGKDGRSKVLGREEIEVFKRKWLCKSPLVLRIGSLLAVLRPRRSVYEWEMYGEIDAD